MALDGLVGKVRRFWLFVFRRDYLRSQLERRRGACRHCRKCCRLLHRCFFLNRSNLCVIYHLPRPFNCRCFPIDEHDLAEVDFTCGFYFVDGRDPGKRDAVTAVARDESEGGN